MGKNRSAGSGDQATEQWLQDHGFRRFVTSTGFVYYGGWNSVTDTGQYWMENDEGGLWHSVPWYLIENLDAPVPSSGPTRQTQVGQQGREITASALSERIAAIYGEVLVGPDVILQEVNGVHYRVGYGLGHGEIDSVQHFWIDYNGQHNYDVPGGGTAFAQWAVSTGAVTPNPIQIIADAKGVALAAAPIYPGLAFVAVDWIFSSALPNVPNPKFVVRGRKCYDPRLDANLASTGVPTRNGTTVVWTRNDALCTADYLVNDWFGVGLGDGKINWDSVIAAANYCDTIVGQDSIADVTFTGNPVSFAPSACALTVSAPPPGGRTAVLKPVFDGNGSPATMTGIQIVDPGMGYTSAPTITPSGFAQNPVCTPQMGEKRHQLDIVLRRPATHEANITTLCQHFRCSLMERAGKVVFVIDQPRASSYTLTKDHIRFRSGHRSGSSKVPTASILTFTNPKKDWQEDTVPLETTNCSQGVEEYRPIETTLEGVTRQNEAARDNAYILNKARTNLDATVEIITTDGQNFERGDRVTVVEDEAAMTGGVDFILDELTDDSNGKIIAKVLAYNPAIYSDTVGAVDFITISGNADPYLAVPPEVTTPQCVVDASNGVVSMYFDPPVDRSTTKYGPTFWSSANCASFDPNRINDGDLATLAADFSPAADSMITFDGGTPIQFGEVHITYSGYTGGGPRIEWSDDGASWSNANFFGFHATGPTSDGLTTVRYFCGWVAGSAHRYWRIRKNNTTAWTQTINEVQWVTLTANQYPYAAKYKVWDARQIPWKLYTEITKVPTSSNPLSIDPITTKTASSWNASIQFSANVVVTVVSEFGQESYGFNNLGFSGVYAGGSVAAASVIAMAGVAASAPYVQQKQGPDIVLLNGANGTISVQAGPTFQKFTGPTAPFSFGGLDLGSDPNGGTPQRVAYDGAQPWTINHEDVGQIASKRINTGTGANFTRPGAGTADFEYDADSSRWLLKSVWPLYVADIIGAAPLASPTFTPTVTISGSTTVGLQYVSSAHAYIRADAAVTSQAAFSWAKAGVQKWAAYVPASSNDLRFNNGSSDVLTIQAGGNVGIGTAPTTPFDMAFGNDTYFRMLDRSPMFADLADHGGPHGVLMRVVSGDGNTFRPLTIFAGTMEVFEQVITGYMSLGHAVSDGTNMLLMPIPDDAHGGIWIYKSGGANATSGFNINVNASKALAFHDNTNGHGDVFWLAADGSANATTFNVGAITATSAINTPSLRSGTSSVDAVTFSSSAYPGLSGARWYMNAVNGGGGTDFALFHNVVGFVSYLITSAFSTGVAIGYIGASYVAPAYPVEVFQASGSDRMINLHGSGGGANALIRFSDGVTSKFSTGFNNGWYIIYDDAASAYRMQIDSSGNVGIGRVAAQFTGLGAWPAGSLDVAGWLAMRSASLHIGGANYRKAAISTPAGDADDPYLAFWTGSAGNNSGVSERMRIDSSGNVGIGTATPAGKLHVSGVGGAANLFAQFANADWNGTTIGSGINIRPGATSGDTYSQIQAFKAGNTPADIALNLSGGNVGIGGTPSGAQLDVTAAASNAAITARGTAGRWTTAVVAPNTVGNSYGLEVVAGTNSVDYCAYFYSAAASTLFFVRGDGLTSTWMLSAGFTGAPRGTFEAQSDLTNANLASGLSQITVSDSSSGNKNVVMGMVTDLNYGYVSTLARGLAWGYYPLILQPLGGHVAIGTNSPLSAAVVQAHIVTNANLILLDAATYWSIAGAVGMQALNDAGSASTPLAIMSSATYLNPLGGNVAIGSTTAPTYTLDIGNGTGTVVVRTNGQYAGAFYANGCIAIGSRAVISGAGTSTDALLAAYGANPLILSVNNTDYANLSGGAATFSVPVVTTSGLVRSQGASTQFQWYETGGAVDEKYFRFIVSGNTLYLQTVNDAFSLAHTWAQFVRSGNTPTMVKFGTPVEVATSLRVKGFRNCSTTGGTYTLDGSDFQVIITGASTGTTTINMPAANQNAGQIIFLKFQASDGGNTQYSLVTSSGQGGWNGNTTGGGLGGTLAGVHAYGGFSIIISDGGSWWVYGA